MGSDLEKISEEDEIDSDSSLNLATNVRPDTKNRLPTGLECTDNLLSGGLEPMEITQIYGPPYSGKTHFCHLLCVVLPAPFHAVYIDTQRSYRREKIQSIATARGLDYANILPRIHCKQPQNSGQQESYIEKISSRLVKLNPKLKLVIIDSFTSLYRYDYPERSQLSERASRLNLSLNKLSTLARANDIAVIITNQHSSHHMAYEDPKPFGGNIVSAMSRYIIRLECRRHNAKSAVLVKSPLHGFRACYLTIADNGFLVDNSLQ